MSDKVTLIIPVRRDADKLERCLRAVQSGTVVPRIVVMDCTADPEKLEKTREKFPGVRFFDLGMNPGRAHAVNTGIHITQTPYVMTLSPGLLVGKHCVERLCAALDGNSNLLSASPHKRRGMASGFICRTCRAGRRKERCKLLPESGDHSRADGRRDLQNGISRGDRNPR